MTIPKGKILVPIIYEDLKNMSLSKLKKVFNYCSEQLKKPLLESEIDRYREVIRVVQFLVQYKG